MDQDVRWAVEHPRRFKLIYGAWSADVAVELVAAAEAAHGRLVALVAEAQDDESLPAGHPERVEALLRALAHGAADLALSGHLSADGKGHATRRTSSTTCSHASRSRRHRVRAPGGRGARY